MQVKVFTIVCVCVCIIYTYKYIHISHYLISTRPNKYVLHRTDLK